ncbi:hypothetical protein SPAN111604_02050 [Sphingomonas antarctica]
MRPNLSASRWAGMFLIAFTCSVAAVTSAGSFQCTDSTRVQLAAVRPVVSASAAPVMLIAQKLRCQGFDSKVPGQLVATCRFQSGEDVGCSLVSQGVAREDANKQQRYDLPTCGERAEARR